jgi:hypothetical protein
VIEIGILAQKFALYANLGILIEFWFTSIYNLLIKNWKLTGYSYGWMLWVYGMAGLVIESIGSAISWPFYLKAFIYMPIFYGIEAISGIVLSLITGKLQGWFGGTGGGTILWNYGHSKWTPMGLINIKYVGFWLLLALAFDPLSGTIHKLINHLATF